LRLAWEQFEAGSLDIEEFGRVLADAIPVKMVPMTPQLRKYRRLLQAMGWDDASEEECAAASKSIQAQMRMSDERFVELIVADATRRSEELADTLDRFGHERAARDLRLFVEWELHPTRAPALSEQVRMGVISASLATFKAAHSAKEDAAGVIALDGARRRAKA